MPAQDRVRGDQAMATQCSGQPPDEGGEHGPVRPVQARSWVGAAQDGDLVAQHEELDVLGGGRAAHQQDQPEHLPEDQVQQPQRHAGIMSDQRSPLVSDPGPTSGTPQVCGPRESAGRTTSPWPPRPDREASTAEQRGRRRHPHESGASDVACCRYAQFRVRVGRPRSAVAPKKATGSVLDLAVGHQQSCSMSLARPSRTRAGVIAPRRVLVVVIAIVVAFNALVLALPESVIPHRTALTDWANLAAAALAAGCASWRATRSADRYRWSWGALAAGRGVDGRAGGMDLPQRHPANLLLPSCGRPRLLALPAVGQHRPPPAPDR